MNPLTLLEEIFERIKSSATVETLFGEPRTVGDKTVIPVAKVTYGFGAGGGDAPAASAETNGFGTAQRSGGGGGGAVHAQPAGFLVITPEEARFLPAVGWPHYLFGLAGGILVGLFLAKSFMKK